MILKKTIFAAAVGLLALASCSKSEKGWSVAGQVNGEDEYTLSLEGFNNGIWYVVDSLRTKDGSFRYSADAPAAYPEIMRVGLDGKFIYFPVDSVDHVEIIADAADFAGNYRLEGTLQAQTIKSLDSLINVSVAERGARVTADDATLKTELFMRAFEAPSVMPLYYLINKTVGDNVLFDPSDAANLRYIGAVAQRFATEKPDDPRGKFLAELYKRAKAARNPNVIQLEVPEMSVIDIVRTDSKGVKHSLSEMASKGDVVLLDFTAYGMENSPALNVILNRLYDKYHSRGLQIYQLAFDDDESFWKENARNLPWTAVWNSTTDGNQALLNYNVGAIPVTFIIDRTGTIVDRIEDPAALEAAVERYF